MNLYLRMGRATKNKDSDFSIKRLRFKNKYFVVVKEKGKIVSQRQWSNKDFTLKDATKKFKRSNTLREDVTKRLKHLDLKEVPLNQVRDRKGQQVSVTYKLSFVPRGRRYRKTIKVTGNSMQFFRRSELNGAREEAEENARLRVAKEFGLPYDEGNAEKVFARVSNVERSEVIIHYDSISDRKATV